MQYATISFSSPRAQTAPLILAALVLGFVTAGPAPADEPATADQSLRRQVQELQAQVEQLRAARAAAPAYSARDVDAVVDTVLRDADRRSQLLADTAGFYGGWQDDKFQIRSADGNFLLHPWFQFQFRGVTNFRQDVKQGGSGDDIQNGFEVRRLKMGFDGNVYGPDLTYNFSWATDRKTGTPVLEFAFAKYHLPGTPWSVRAGQFKDPLDHEQLTSTAHTAAVDRTITDDLFANGEGYVQGVSLLYDDAGGAFRAEAAFTDGLRSANTNFQDYPTTVTAGNAPPADWGAAARVEYKFFGDWKEYARLSAYGAKHDLLVLGAGVDYTEAGDTDALTHVVDVHAGTAGGLGLYAAYLGRYTRNSAAAGGDDTYDWTARGQISYVLNKNWEPFVQYEYIHLDAPAFGATAAGDFQKITAGVTYYLKGHSAKFSIDFSYLPDGSLVNDDGAGVLRSADEQFVIRGQFQLLL